MKSIDEHVAEAAAYREKQYAQVHKERAEAGQATITLIRSANDPPLLSVDYQAEFEALRKALSNQGVDVESPFVVMDAVEGGAGYIGELVLRIAAIAGPVVGVVVGAWLQSKAGRKVRVKIGEVEVEASTKEALTTGELEKLVKRALKEHAKSGAPKD